jgi:hypothetical protein
MHIFLHHSSVSTSFHRHPGVPVGAALGADGGRTDYQSSARRGRAENDHPCSNGVTCNVQSGEKFGTKMTQRGVERAMGCDEMQICRFAILVL